MQGVKTMIFCGRTFESNHPDRTTVVSYGGWPRAVRKRIMTLWGLLPRQIPFLVSIRWPVFKHLVSGRYDIVYTYMLSSGDTILTFLLCHLLWRNPYVVMAEHWYPRNNKLIMAWYRLVTRNAALVVSQSTKGQQFMVDTLGVAPERSVLCFNTVEGLEREPYNHYLARRIRSDEGPVVVCIGRLVPFKGQDVLIRAFREVAPRNARLYLVGSDTGPYASRCKVLAEEDPRILFVGHAPFQDVLAYYREADLFALANQFTDHPVEGAESFGYAPLEAGYMGLPLLLTTATGCADDVVVEGVTGFQLEAGDHDEIRNTLGHLTQQPDQLKQMGTAAMNHCRSICSRDAINELERRIEQLIERPSSSS